MSISSNFKVKDVMFSLDETPHTTETALLKEAFEIMDEYHLGIICILKPNGELKGIITDGDIRRVLNNVQKPIAAIMNDDVIRYANLAPVTISSNEDLKKAVEMTGSLKVWDLPVVDKDKLIGLFHLHPAIDKLLDEQK